MSDVVLAASILGGDGTRKSMNFMVGKSPGMAGKMCPLTVLEAKQKSASLSFQVLVSGLWKYSVVNLLAWTWLCCGTTAKN